MLFWHFGRESPPTKTNTYILRGNLPPLKTTPFVGGIYIYIYQPRLWKTCNLDHDRPAEVGAELVGCFNPIDKYESKLDLGSSSPRFGMKIPKNIWVSCHQPVFFFSAPAHLLTGIGWAAHPPGVRSRHLGGFGSQENRTCGVQTPWRLTWW